jgi:hypothetical protein
MKAHTVAGLIAAGLILVSCGGGRQPVEITANTEAIATRWNGTLASPPELAGIVAMSGQAWMAPDEKTADRSRASVEISNAVPGGVHPWHVHRGRCGTDQGILGPPDSYKPLKVGSNGRASSTAVISVPFSKTGEYFVNIHASSKNLRTIVACGNLAPPAR